jgi:hypothetical protein
MLNIKTLELDKTRSEITLEKLEEKDIEKRWSIPLQIINGKVLIQCTQYYYDLNKLLNGKYIDYDHVFGKKI